MYHKILAQSKKSSSQSFQGELIKTSSQIRMSILNNIMNFRFSKAFYILASSTNNHDLGNLVQLQLTAGTDLHIYRMLLLFGSFCISPNEHTKGFSIKDEEIIPVTSARDTFIKMFSNMTKNEELGMKIINNISVVYPELIDMIFYSIGNNTLYENILGLLHKNKSTEKPAIDDTFSDCIID